MSKSYSSSEADPTAVKKALEEFFPGFTIQHVKDSKGANNYVVQHEDKRVMEALSTQLADEHGAKIKGGSGNPKYVADHQNNGSYGIVLTDKDHTQLVGHQAFARRVTDNPDAKFEISAESIKGTLPKSFRH